MTLNLGDKFIGMVLTLAFIAGMLFSGYVFARLMAQGQEVPQATAQTACQIEINRDVCEMFSRQCLDWLSRQPKDVGKSGFGQKEEGL